MALPGSCGPLTTIAADTLHAMSRNAYVIPNPSDHSFDTRAVAGVWLHRAPAPRVLIVPTVGQQEYVLGKPRNVHVLTHRTRWNNRPREARSVLVIFGDAEDIELGESLDPEFLCVVDYTRRLDVAAWVAANDPEIFLPKDWHGDTSVLPDYAQDGHGAVELPDQVERRLEHLIAANHHNSFVDSYGKRDAVLAFRDLRQSHPDLDTDQLRMWLLGHPQMSAASTDRLMGFFEGVRAGKRFRGMHGRLI